MITSIDTATRNIVVSSPSGKLRIGKVNFTARLYEALDDADASSDGGITKLSSAADCDRERRDVGAVNFSESWG